MKIHNIFTFPRVPVPEPQEEPETSLTIPDQAMSLQEILARYVRGQELPTGQMPIYEDEGSESSGINPKTLDLAEIQQLREETEETLERFKSNENAKQQKQRKDAERQRIRKELEAEEAQDQSVNAAAADLPPH